MYRTRVTSRRTRQIASGAPFGGRKSSGRWRERTVRTAGVSAGGWFATWALTHVDGRGRALWRVAHGCRDLEARNDTILGWAYAAGAAIERQWLSDTGTPGVFIAFQTNRRTYSRILERIFTSVKDVTAVGIFILFCSFLRDVW